MGATQCIPSISFITKYKENKKNINYSHYYKFNDSQKIGANFLSNMATSQQAKNSREVTIVAAQLLVRYCQSDVNLGPSFGIISLYIQRARGSRFESHQRPKIFRGFQTSTDGLGLRKILIRPKNDDWDLEKFGWDQKS